MTAYMCEADEVCDSRGVWHDPPEAPEWFKPMDVVIAASRGSAKTLFYNKYSWHIEFTDIRAAKLSAGEQGPARIVEAEDPRHDPLWAAYEAKLNPYLMPCCGEELDFA